MEKLPKLNEAIALTIRELRAGTMLSQAKMAEAADVSESYIYLLERGTREPTLSHVMAIANAAGIEGWELVRRIEQRRISLLGDE